MLRINILPQEFHRVPFLPFPIRTSHILDENCRTNAELIEKAFYAGKGSEPDASSDGKKKIAEAAETEKQESVSLEQLAKLLTNPEVINMLKVLSKTIGN